MSDPQLVTCYRKQLRTATAAGVDPAIILLAWKMSDEDISINDLLDVYKQETEPGKDGH
jgi:hypothetical protein